MKTLLLPLLAGIAVSTASTACPVFQKPEPVAVLSEIDAALHRAAREGNAKTRLYNVVEDPFQKSDLSSRAEQQDRLRAMERTLDERLCP